MKPKRWLRAALAFFANLFLAPLGYVVAGSVKMAVIVIVVLVLLAAVTFLSLAFPPGLYGALHGSLTSGTAPFAAMILNLGFGVHAAWLAFRIERPDLAGRARWLAGAGLTAIPVGAAVFAWFCGPIGVYSIPSSSMAPTLVEGDIVSVWGAKNVCRGIAPRIGQVVTHHKVGDPVMTYIRRVVAGPGDTVGMSNGDLVVNGRPVTVREAGSFDLKLAESSPNSVRTGARLRQETLANGASHPIVDLEPATQVDAALDNVAPVKLQPGMWFLMGDNRRNAADSRIDGPIPTSMICGVADKIIWSRDPRRIGRRP